MNEPAHPPTGVRTVYLHIGTFKTGTTYLQQVMGANRERLADAGVLFPGTRWQDQSFAVHDLIGKSPRDADEPRIPGAWQALVSEVQQWQGPAALISVEFLSLANVRQARRAVRAFEPADVHVILTARDLARVVPAMWQEGLKVGATAPWEEYAASVMDGSRIGFWNTQDLVALLDTWEHAVPRERIHVVTVPAQGAPTGLLLERFCSVVGVDADTLDPDVKLANTSVGAAEAEVLRRLNLSLGGRLNDRQRKRVVRRVIARRLMTSGPTGRVTLTPEQRAQAAERGRKMADVLGERGYHVVGDLDELVADVTAPSGEQQTTDAQLLDAAMVALTEITDRFARNWWSDRKPDVIPEGRSRRAKAGTAVRRMRRRPRTALGALARRNRAVGRLARVYVALRGRMRSRG